MRSVTLFIAVMWLIAGKLHAGCPQKISFESWKFSDGYHAIVAAPAELAAGVPFRVYAGYRRDGGKEVYEGPRPATYSYVTTNEKGEWGTLTTENAQQAAYRLTDWSDGNYAGQWNRKNEGMQMILDNGQNPPVSKSIWYKFDYDTGRIMQEYEHTNDQREKNPIQSYSATPLVWKTESFMSEPAKGTAPGTRRCMPRSASSYLYQIVMCVSTNVSGTNTLA